MTFSLGSLRFGKNIPVQGMAERTPSAGSFWKKRWPSLTWTKRWLQPLDANYAQHNQSSESYTGGTHPSYLSIWLCMSFHPDTSSEHSSSWIVMGTNFHTKISKNTTSREGRGGGALVINLRQIEPSLARITGYILTKGACHIKICTYGPKFYFRLAMTNQPPTWLYYTYI